MTETETQDSSTTPGGNASEVTRAAHARATADLPLHDRSDYEHAARGFVATIDPPTIRNDAGRVVWDLSTYDFLAGAAPDTVHPSLWRLAQLNCHHHGLFTVAPGLHQIRGFDISNMSIVEGDTGYIVIDPLTCVETAAAGMRLVREQLGDKPVTAVIYSHSHLDHFGGARAVVSADDIASGRVPVVAPSGFYEHAVSENVHAGAAMGRRGQFMFGSRLPRGPRGQVSTGLGQTLPHGTSSLLEPSHVVGETGTELVLDGVRIVFQFTPGAEAPAEMNFHLPGLRALCMAETVSHQMHNLYTPRGAQVRDALAWSTYLDEAIRLFGADSDVMFISHHWPVWGTEELCRHIAMHRDLYRYIHDETLRLANHGHTPVEIAETVALPRELDRFWGNRGCYGTLSHNVKAVYQRYLGWFDGNPAHLDPLPPTEAGTRYVELAGGPAALLARATDAYEAGDYRWAAELLGHGLAADPADGAVRDLQARVFTQLGYRAESGPWRNFYLQGAEELRTGIPSSRTSTAANPDFVAGMADSMLFDFMAIRLNGPRAADGPAAEFHLTVTDRGQTYRVRMENGLLHHWDADRPATNATAITLTHQTLAELALGSADVDEALADGRIEVTGDDTAVRRTFGLLDSFSRPFDVVAPNPPPAGG